MTAAEGRQRRETILTSLLGFDDQLASKKFHRLTPWWKARLTQFFRSRARLFVGRVGRGGIKSTTAVKVALAIVLFGEFEIPPGERHYFAFVSVGRDEAAQRLRLLEAYLRALGIKFTRAADTIDLVGMPRGFKVLTCSVEGTSGFRCIGFAADEAAKWSNADGSANPAKEVIASLRAMTVTHPNALEFIISSPLSTVDYHYELVERGSNEHQIVAIAPTWVANPSITEDQTHALEPDARIWAREYRAIPQASSGSAFDYTAIERAMRLRSAPTRRGTPHLILDPSSGKKDTLAWGVCRWNRAHDARVYLAFDLIDGIEGRFFEQVDANAVADRLATVARQHGAEVVHSDQRESFSLRGAINSRDLEFVEHPWTNAGKIAAVEKLRAWFRDDVIALPAHEKLRRELATFEEKFTPTGALTYGARGSGHDDYVALLITAAMADIEGFLDAPSGGGGFVPMGVPSRTRGMVGASRYDEPEYADHRAQDAIDDGGIGWSEEELEEIFSSDD